MTKTNAVATLYSKTEHTADETTLAFSADYNDEVNKAWAKYTPALSISMVVINSVAETFEVGKTYLVTFEPKVAD